MGSAVRYTVENTLMEILDEKHRGVIAKFKSTDSELNEFLNKDAFHFIRLKLGVSYLLIDKSSGDLISYSTLSTGAVRIDDEKIFRGLRRKDYPKDLPNQFPALLVGRLATDASNGLLVQAVGRWVFDFGGGADVRLSRPFSLRVEVRDFVGGKGLSGVDGRHHVIALGGIALHF